MSNVVSMPNKKQSLEDAFPQAAPGALPLGDRVLVQLRVAKRMTKGGIILPEESRDQERWVTTIGKVVALGPLAYRDREDPTKEWPEGIWCREGDFVRVPKWGGDRWDVAMGEGNDSPVARFVIYRDKEIIAKITGDPLSFTDYI